MRIAHATDIHWMVPPNLNDLSFKRFLGTANLYIRGRRHRFTQESQDALMNSLLECEADLLIVTGDLTAQALDGEFALAKQGLTPLLSTIPTFIVPGNHDVYTQRTERERTCEKWFGQWMHLEPSGLGYAEFDQVAIVGIDPNRPTVLAATGRVPQTQLDALPEMLARVPDSKLLIIAIHYPVVDRHGGIYNGSGHGLLNVEDLLSVFKASSRKPDVLLHGHEHHGYTRTVDLDGHQLTIFNPGSSGYAYQPEKDRAGCFNVYTVEDGTLESVERYRLGPDGFVPEEGGAYASGR